MNSSRLLRLCIMALLLAIALIFTGGPLWAADDEIIIDNGYTGTTQSGIWTSSTAPNPYEGDSVYAYGSRTNPPTYTWQAIVPRRGTYNVYLWWTVYQDANGNTNRSANVPVDIQDRNGTYRVTVNQRKDGGQWNKLGTFTFDTIGTVTLTANTYGYTFSADAVRFEYVYDDTVTIDNGDPGTTAAAHGRNPLPQTRTERIPTMPAETAQTLPRTPGSPLFRSAAPTMSICGGPCTGIPTRILTAATVFPWTSRTGTGHSRQ